jgi:hypothetical protein
LLGAPKKLIQSSSWWASAPRVVLLQKNAFICFDCSSSDIVITFAKDDGFFFFGIEVETTRLRDVFELDKSPNGQFDIFGIIASVQSRSVITGLGRSYLVGVRLGNVRLEFDSDVWCVAFTNRFHSIGINMINLIMVR